MSASVQPTQSERVALSTKASVLHALDGGADDVAALCRVVGVPAPVMVAHLSSLRREGWVTFREHASSTGMTDIALTASGKRKVARLEAAGIATDMLGEGVHLQPTLSPIAPRRTLETGVVSIASGRSRRAAQPASIAEGGPVTVTHEPAGRPETPAPPAPAPMTPPPAVATAGGILDGLPLIAEIAGRSARRASAEAAAVMLEAAGLPDLALEAMTAIGEDDPLAREVMVLLARVAP